MHIGLDMMPTDKERNSPTNGTRGGNGLVEIRRSKRKGVVVVPSESSSSPDEHDHQHAHAHAHADAHGHTHAHGYRHSDDHKRDVSTSTLASSSSSSSSSRVVDLEDNIDVATTLPSPTPAVAALPAMGPAAGVISINIDNVRSKSEAIASKMNVAMDQLLQLYRQIPSNIGHTRADDVRFGISFDLSFISSHYMLCSLR
jgi:hypothetical protein